MRLLELTLFATFTDSDQLATIFTQGLHFTLSNTTLQYLPLYIKDGLNYTS